MSPKGEICFYQWYMCLMAFFFQWLNTRWCDSTAGITDTTNPRSTNSILLTQPVFYCHGSASCCNACSSRNVCREIYKNLLFSNCCYVKVQSEDRNLDETLKSSRCQLSDEDVTPRDSPSHHGSGDGTTSPYGYRGKREAPPYRDPPGPISPVQRALPPYRDPPPVSSPARSLTPHTPGPLPSQDNRSDIISSPPSSSGKMKTKRNLMKVCAKLYPNFNYIIKILCLKKLQKEPAWIVFTAHHHICFLKT